MLRAHRQSRCDQGFIEERDLVMLKSNYELLLIINLLIIIQSEESHFVRQLGYAELPTRLDRVGANHLR